MPKTRDHLLVRTLSQPESGPQPGMAPLWNACHARKEETANAAIKQSRIRMTSPEGIVAGFAIGFLRDTRSS